MARKLESLYFDQKGVLRIIGYPNQDVSAVSVERPIIINFDAMDNPGDIEWDDMGSIKMPKGSVPANANAYMTGSASLHGTHRNTAAGLPVQFYRIL